MPGAAVKSSLTAVPKGLKSGIELVPTKVISTLLFVCLLPEPPCRPPSLQGPKIQSTSGPVCGVIWSRLLKVSFGTNDQNKSLLLPLREFRGKQLLRWEQTSWASCRSQDHLGSKWRGLGAMGNPSWRCSHQRGTLPLPALPVCGGGAGGRSAGPTKC